MEKAKRYLTTLLRQALPGNSPDFMIIGAQKSGTTSLHYYLGQHPNLTASKPKEIHYFDKWVNYGYSIDWYRKHFTQKSLRSQLYFESSPNYIYYKNVASQVAIHFPKIKLIVLLRDPVERAFSAWNMYRDFFDGGKKAKVMKPRKPGEINSIFRNYFQDRITFPTFGEAIEIELKLMEEGMEAEPAILRRGLYAQQLEVYYKYFDKDAILVLGFKDLVNELQSTLKRVTGFLGVQDFDFDSIEKEPRNRRAYTESVSLHDKEFLLNFFRTPNTDLFELLGYQPNW